MNYYIDFDYTLFDTYKFREGLYEILENNGLDRSYLALTPEMKNSGQKLLNIRNLFKVLSEEKNIALKNFINPLEELYSKCDEFLYDDSIEFLEYLKSKGHKLYLLTWGEKVFQEEKVRFSKIDKYFDDMIFTEELKYTLPEIDYTQGVFLDDSIRDLEGLFNAGAKKVVRIIRKNGKNSDKVLNIKKIKEYCSLKELQECLENEEE